MREKRHLIFGSVWRGVNALLIAALVVSGYAGLRENSLRRYLDGFSDAVVPESGTAEEKVEAILTWMRDGPKRSVTDDASELSKRDPEVTLNYEQLLKVCGTATNAFLNLGRSGGLEVRRLLLLTPDRDTKHVVAEVLIDGRWIVADPTYRALLRDARGPLPTRTELRNPAIFAEAIRSIPGYSPEYAYEQVAHVQLARLPRAGPAIRRVLDGAFPGWEESFDGSLLLERESFLILVSSVCLVGFLLILRGLLAWRADNRRRIPRFHLREHALRAGVAFFSTPEIKQ